MKTYDTEKIQIHQSIHKMKHDTLVIRYCPEILKFSKHSKSLDF